MLIVLGIAFFAASLTLFLNYCIGKPGGEFSPFEIFSFYTVWLSKMRLQNIGLLKQYDKERQENLQRAKTEAQVIETNNEFKRVYYNAAEPFFTWERAVGMCPICTGFWISLVVGILFTRDFLLLGEIIVFSHVLIRILVKFL